MTREEFMDIVYSELHSDGDNYRANRIIDAADEYMETQSRWIPVSDKLPEIDGEYLVTYEEYFTPDHVDDINHKKSIGILCYLNKYGWFHDGVYAWMPLPDPFNS